MPSVVVVLTEVAGDVERRTQDPKWESNTLEKPGSPGSVNAGRAAGIADGVRVEEGCGLATVGAAEALGGIGIRVVLVCCDMVLEVDQAGLRRLQCL